MKTYHLAQINIAKIKGVTLEDPIMKEFMDNLDRVNQLADESPGFVWRMTEEDDHPDNENPLQAEQMIINVSVWETVAALEQYVYKTVHGDFLRRRKEWFQRYAKAKATMWWLPEGQLPTVQQGLEKLAIYEQNGASEIAFDFKNRYEKPVTS